MNIARNVTIPIMIALMLISLLIAALTVVTAESEFYQFDHVGDMMPHLSGVFRSVYAFAWLLPAIAVGISIWLVRRPERTGAQFAWSVTIITVLTIAWSAFAFVALYLLHVTSYYL